jgi:hypothetical protein
VRTWEISTRPVPEDGAERWRMRLELRLRPTPRGSWLCSAGPALGVHRGCGSAAPLPRGVKAPACGVWAGDPIRSACARRSRLRPM